MALLTGSDTPTGAALATALACRGMDLLLCGSAGDTLLAAKTRLEGDHGIHVQLFAGNLAKPGVRQELLGLIGAQNLKLDVFVHADGQLICEDRLQAGQADMRLLDEQHLRAPDELLRGGLLARMLEEGNGFLLLVTGSAALEPVPGAARFSALQHALLGLGLAWRGELAGSGVSLTVACPARLHDDVLQENPDRRAEQMLRALFARQAVWVERRSCSWSSIGSLFARTAGIDKRLRNRTSQLRELLTERS